VLGDMLDVIRHRGPDDSGVYLDKDVALGMRRLSIIDLSGGKQPISNEDGTIVIVSTARSTTSRNLGSSYGAGHSFDGERYGIIVHLYRTSAKIACSTCAGCLALPYGTHAAGGSSWLAIAWELSLCIRTIGRAAHLRV